SKRDWSSDVCSSDLNCIFSYRYIKLGTFYVAVGEDAVLLHKKVDLKCTCYKMNICKVGFPVIALDKYVEKLNETKYAYVIYDYRSEERRVEKERRAR